MSPVSTGMGIASGSRFARSRAGCPVRVCLLSSPFPAPCWSCVGSWVVRSANTERTGSAAGRRFTLRWCRCGVFSRFGLVSAVLMPLVFFPRQRTRLAFSSGWFILWISKALFTRIIPTSEFPSYRCVLPRVLSFPCLILLAGEPGDCAGVSGVLSSAQLPWEQARAGFRTGLAMGLLCRATQCTMAPRGVLHHPVMDSTRHEAPEESPEVMPRTGLQGMKGAEDAEDVTALPQDLGRPKTRKGWMGTGCRV